MFVVDRSDAHRVGRREALLDLFNRRLDQLDSASRCNDAATGDLARLTLVRMVPSLEAAGRGEYRVRDARP